MKIKKLNIKIETYFSSFERMKVKEKKILLNGKGEYSGRL